MSTIKERPTQPYVTAFERWDDESYIRVKKRPEYTFQLGLDYFSRSLSPLFHLPQVLASPPDVQNELLVHNLYTYLEFTVFLELGPVNEVSTLLQSDSFLPWIPPAMKDDAMKVYTDEAGHAEMCRALRDAVQKHTKIQSLRLQPRFLRELDALIGSQEQEYHDFVKLFFVIVSETLITGTLSKLPHDETVQQPIRDVVLDHAQDESRHYRYFKALFEFIWPRLPRNLRRWAVEILPPIILAFLSPDKEAIEAILLQYPDHFARPGLIALDIVNSAATIQAVRRSAAPTLSMLAANNVFSETGAVETFQRYRLDPQQAPAHI